MSKKCRHTPLSGGSSARRAKRRVNERQKISARSRFGRMEPVDWLAPAFGALSRGLRLALIRAPFRIQRVWRALRQKETLKTSDAQWSSVFIKLALRINEERVIESKSSFFRPVKKPRFKGRGARREAARASVSRAVDQRASLTGVSDGRERLWNLMRARGVDFWSVDKNGRGFQEWACQLAARSSRMMALSYWAGVGGSARREGAEFGLLELCALRVDICPQDFESLERLWPEECSRQSSNTMLGDFPRLSERASKAGFWRFDDDGGADEQWESLMSSSNAVSLISFIELARLEAVGPNRSLSQWMDQVVGIPAGEAIKAAESAAIARAERDELLSQTRAAGRAVELTAIKKAL